MRWWLTERVHASQFDVGARGVSVRVGALPGSTFVLILWLAVAAIVPSPSPAAEPFAAMGLSTPPRTRASSDFTLRTAAGQTVRLGDHRGQVVFLNFWATWCPACRVEIPAIQRLHARFKDRGLVVLAVSIDTGGRETVASFAADQRLMFPIALDPAMAVATRYGVRALPSTFLVDRRGQIRAMAVGPREWDTPAAHTVIETLLIPAGDASSRAATGRTLGPRPPADRAARLEARSDRPRNP